MPCLPTGGNYLIISHPNFLVGPNGTNPVQEYADYRASAVGGSYTSKIYMIDQLIDQFSFGIKQHPLSVRNFIRFGQEPVSERQLKMYLS